MQFCGGAAAANGRRRRRRRGRQLLMDRGPGDSRIMEHRHRRRRRRRRPAAQPPSGVARGPNFRHHAAIELGGAARRGGSGGRDNCGAASIFAAAAVAAAVARMWHGCGAAEANRRATAPLIGVKGAANAGGVAREVFHNAWLRPPPAAASRLNGCIGAQRLPVSVGRLMKAGDMLERPADGKQPVGDGTKPGSWMRI